MIMVILYFQESPDLLPAEFRNSHNSISHFKKKKRKKLRTAMANGTNSPQLFDF